MPTCMPEILTCTCGGIHSGRVEPVSPRHSDVSLVGSTPRAPTPGVSAFSGLEAQAQLVV